MNLKYFEQQQFAVCTFWINKKEFFVIPITGLNIPFRYLHC